MNKLSPKSDICVVGAGAAGLFFSAVLSSSHSVRLLTRLKHIPVPASKTLKISGEVKCEKELAADSGSLKLIAFKEVGSLPLNTIYIVAVKAYDLDGALSSLLPHLSRRTPVVLIQNGLGIHMQASGIVGRKAPLIRLLLSTGFKKTAPLETTVSGKLCAAVAWIEDDTTEAKRVCPLLEEAGFDLSYPQNIAQAEWEKAALNLAVNPLASVLNSKNSSVISSEAARGLTAEILREVRETAQAEGFDLSHLRDEVVFKMIKQCGENINSTLCDLRSGRKTELGFMLGRFLDIAARYQVKAPVLKTLNSVCLHLERSKIRQIL